MSEQATPLPSVVGRREIFDRQLRLIGYEVLLANRSARDPIQGRDGRDLQPVTTLTAAAPRREEGPVVARVEELAAAPVDLARLSGGHALFCTADGEPVRPVDRSSTGTPPEIWQSGSGPASGSRIEIRTLDALAVEDARGDGTGRVPSVRHQGEVAVVVEADRNGRAAGPVSGDQRRLIQDAVRHGMSVLVAGVTSLTDVDTFAALGASYFRADNLTGHQLRMHDGPPVADASALSGFSGALGELVDFDELEQVLRGQPVLTHEIMRLASLGPRGQTGRRLSSIREALVLAGSWRIQNWIALHRLRETGNVSDDVMLTTLTCARACELLATVLWDRAAGRVAFTAGMLATFEPLLGIPRAVLEELALSDDLRGAAFGDQTPLGRLVRDVEARVTGRGPFLLRSSATNEALDDGCAEALGWALEMTAGS